MQLPLYVVEPDIKFGFAPLTSFQTPIIEQLFIPKEHFGFQEIILVFRNPESELTAEELMRTESSIEVAKNTLPIGILCRVIAYDQMVDELPTAHLHAVDKVDISTVRWVSENVYFETELNRFRDDLEDLTVEQIAETIRILDYAAGFVGIPGFETIDLFEHKVDTIACAFISDTQKRLDYIQTRDITSRFLQLTLIFKNLEIPFESNESNSGSNKPVKKARVSRRKSKRGSKKQESALDKYLKRLANLDVDEETGDYILNEIQRLERLNSSSSEYQVAVEYVENVLNIPWGVKTNAKIDFATFRTALDSTHYGLDDVKDYILEQMVIEHIANVGAGVVCFVGPPGTGKTSIAKSIAEQTNRPLAQIALGGMTDESALRGHRRTYVAARPGRIVKALQQHQTMTPLFLLDEIDKMSSGRGGDPASALLEVLDPNQNDKFVDRYLELPIDVSDAMFICTANYEEQIPPALKDRMEIIRFREYTKDERKNILEDYLLDKIVNEYNAHEFDISITDEVIEELSNISAVRQMEKQLRKLYRKAIVDIFVKGKEEVVVDIDYFNGKETHKIKNTRVGF